MSNTFSKIIDGKEFNFQTFEFGNSAGYYVNVVDEEGTRWEFSILHTDKNDPAKMKIEDLKLPPWIHNQQATLIKVINEQE
ncbi:MAG: hypothetical protein ABIS01_09745 [Ferruginibacter sp.]